MYMTGRIPGVASRVGMDELMFLRFVCRCYIRSIDDCEGRTDDKDMAMVGNAERDPSMPSVASC